MKTELKIIYEKMDNLEPLLSLFQIAFIKDVYYFQTYNGEYKYNENYVIDKYKNIGTKEELLLEINNLLDNSILDCRIKRTIYNGNFITIKTLKLITCVEELTEINNEFIENNLTFWKKLDSYNKE